MSSAQAASLPEPEPTGAIVWLYATAAGLANIFAIYWLVRATLAQFPGAVSITRFWRRREDTGTTRNEKNALSSEAEVIHVHVKPQALRRDGGSAVLEWRDLCYSVRAGKSGREHKLLLQGIWGSLRSGQLMALMGPSGAGKSTLLELLAMRRAVSAGPGCEDGQQTQDGQGTTESTRRGVVLNGSPASASRIKAVSSYVPQDDVLLPQMTVWEVLTLHAGLRMARATSRADRAVRQREVMEAMGLTQQRDTLVGGVLPGGILLRGVSGGERKRLAIGAGLLPSPMFLFADEPTSGLDAFAAMTVMGHLADQAHGTLACAVMVSIHQPRAAIWDMTDKVKRLTVNIAGCAKLEYRGFAEADMVLLLSRGCMVYEGFTPGLLPWLGDSLPRLLGPPFHAGLPPFHFDPEHHGTIADWAMDLVCMTDEQLIDAAGCVAGETPAASPAGPALLESSKRTEATLPETEAAEHHPIHDPFQSTGHNATWVSRAAKLFLDTCVTSRIQHGDVETVEGAPAATSRAAGTAADASHVVASATSDATGGAQNTLDVFQRGENGLDTAGGAAGGPALDGPASQANEEGADGAEKGGQASRWEPLLQWFAMYKVLVWREALAAVRNPADVGGRMLTFVWVSLLGNFLLYGGGKEGDNAGSMRVRVAWLYFLLFFFMVIPFLFMSVFTADKRFYLADVSSGLYRPGPYYCAKLTASLPLNVLISLAFVLTAYGMFGYRHSVLAAVQMAVVATLFNLVALQWIFFASALSPSQDIAFVLSVAFAVVNLLVHSFFMGPEDLSGLMWIRYLRYISAMDMAWQGLATAELKDRTFSCAEGGRRMGVDVLGLFVDFIPNSTDFQLVRYGIKNPGENCLASGNAALKYYDTYPNVAMHVGELVAYLLVLHVFTYLAFRLATYRVTRAQRGGSTVAGG